MHQVNLEYLARGVHRKDGVYYPDTLVGTDSHTTMINGIGVVGWASAGHRGRGRHARPAVYFLTAGRRRRAPEGQAARGRHRHRPRADDHRDAAQGQGGRQVRRVLGEGTATLALPDRATIANMAPEYGATMGFFPVDEKTIAYFEGTGRTPDENRAFEAYFRAQGMFGVPKPARSTTPRCCPSTCRRSHVAGWTEAPQDRIEIGQVKKQFASLFSKPTSENGFNQPAARLKQRFPWGPRAHRAQGGRRSGRSGARPRRDDGQPPAGEAGARAGRP